ncbi:hypothetical protein [Nocardia sp. NPDC056100]|uniref:DUF6630 family protein n=1 Tax=Nocardia sp. NPDC056100 TaxID=3345712 RepID=UPI0035DC63BE
MEFDDGRQAWVAVARCIAPTRTVVAQAILSGEDDPYDDLRSGLDDAGMSVYVDWRSNPDDIRSDLSEMGTFPAAFSWDWYADFVGDTTLDWDATNDTMSLLEEIGEHCLEIGFALISLELDADGYDLTTIDCARLEELLDLTTQAGRPFRVLRRPASAKSTPKPTRQARATGAARLMDLLRDSLTESMLQAGYSVSAPLDDEPGESFKGQQLRSRRLWFSAPEGEIVGMTPAIVAWIHRGSGQLAIRGTAWLASSAAGDMARSVSQQGLRGDDEVESVSFGYFDNRHDPGRALYLSTETDLDWCVGNFMNYVRGPVDLWQSARDSMDKLFALARTGNPRDARDPVNPDWTRLRAVAVLGIENGRSQASAELLQWYSKRPRFAPPDSAERVAAFDAVLAQRYPDYARYR